MSPLAEKLLELYTTKSFKKNKEVIKQNLKWLDNNRADVLATLTGAVDYCEAFKKLIEENIKANKDEIEKVADTNRDDVVSALGGYLDILNNIKDSSYSLLRIAMLEDKIALIKYSYANYLDNYIKIWKIAK